MLSIDNIFPDDTTCYYKGKEVPAFITFSDGGGIDGSILTQMFMILDKLNLYDDDT